MLSRKVLGGSGQAEHARQSLAINMIGANDERILKMLLAAMAEKQ